MTEKNFVRPKMSRMCLFFVVLQGAGERRGLERDVYVMIPPKPFRRGPPLNSMAFLRLKSTKKKHRKDVVFNSLRGAPNRLVPSGEISGILKAHD